MLSKRTRDEMLAGHRELRRKAGLPMLPFTEEIRWLTAFMEANARLDELKAWIGSGKVIEFPIVPRDPHRAVPYGVTFCPLASSTYIVYGGEHFIDEDPLLFPSPEFLARIILAVEFAPRTDDGTFPKGKMKRVK